MRFKVDENVPVDCVEDLRRAGHDAVSVAEQRLSGAADSKVFDICTAEGRVLVSLDLDFADIRTYPPGEGAGIVVFRLKSQDASAVREVVARVVELLPEESLLGKLWIDEKDRIRIRD